MNKMNEQQDVVVHQKMVDEIFGEIKDDFQGARISKLVRFDNEKDKIIFTDGIFLSGSAKVTTEVQQALNSAKPKIIRYLSELENCLIYIEGHSDNTPVIHPVINKEKYGAVYDDNYTLSAARAREARNVLLGELPEEFANRIIVAGYGSSRPLPGTTPSDQANRRIEIRFVLEAKEKADNESTTADNR